MKEMFVNNKEIKKVVKEAEKQGWTFRNGRNSHLVGRCPHGTRIISISSSPSNINAIHGVKRDLQCTNC